MRGSASLDKEGITLAATTEAATSSIAEPRSSVGRKERASRRRRGSNAPEPSGARFFQIKTSGNGTVELGQEVGSENDAIVESFRIGGTFAVVTEWKATVDLSTGSPVIKKEAVKSEKK